MEGNNHNHGPGCGCAGFEVSNEDDNLHVVIDIPKTVCLNEERRDSCQEIVQSEEYRLAILSNIPQANTLNSVENDPEILLVVTFTEEVKVRAV